MTEKNNIKYHFFGKDCIIDRALLNREDLLKGLENKGLKCDELLFVNQIHSSEVVIIDEKNKLYDMHNLPKADAIVTNLKNIAIAVFTADCAPVFLFDEKNMVIAALHAGWRGAKFGIVKQTIRAMKNLGAENIKAIIGPMIQQNSYEISQEYFDDFLLEKENNKKFFKAKSEQGRYLFDLPAYVMEKLQEEKIAEIENSAIDTYKNEESFFSFRRSSHRQEKDCGRNVSVILIN